MLYDSGAHGGAGRVGLNSGALNSNISSPTGRWCLGKWPRCAGFCTCRVNGYGGWSLQVLARTSALIKDNCPLEQECRRDGLAVFPGSCSHGRDVTPVFVPREVPPPTSSFLPGAQLLLECVPSRHLSHLKPCPLSRAQGWPLTMWVSALGVKSHTLWPMITMVS